MEISYASDRIAGEQHVDPLMYRKRLERKETIPEILG